MPVTRNEREYNSHREYYDAIKALRKGSLSDALALSAEVATVPTELLPDLLDAFLSHVGPHKLPPGHLQRAPVEKAYILGLYSFRGVAALVEVDAFATDARLGSRLLQSWKDIFYCTKNFHERALDRDIFELLPFLKSSFVLIFNKLSILNVEELVAICEDLEFQTFVSRLWLEVPDENDTAYFESSKLIWSCLRYTSCMDCLLRLAGGPEPARTVAKSTIDRLDFLVNKVPFWYRDCGLVAMECAIFQALMSHPNHEITLALVDDGGFKLILKSLRYATKMINNGLCEDERQPYLAAGSCLTFLSVAFEVKPKLIRKAIRGGYISTLLSVSPHMERLEQIRPKTVLACKYSLKIIIPRELVFPNNVELVAESIRNASPEARRNIRASQISDEWIEVERLVMERLAILRIGDMSERLARCSTCHKLDLKHVLKKCGKCSHSLYCSKFCQATAWSSLGHREYCGKPTAPESNPKSAYDRDARMRHDMLLRDISRYSKDMKRKNLELKLELDIDPMTHAIKLTYLMNLHIEVLDFMHVFRDDIFNDTVASQAEIDYWMDQLEKADGAGVLCLMVIGSGQEMIAQLQIVPMRMKLWNPPDLPHPPELVRPTSSIPVVYTKKPEVAQTLTPDFDAVEHLLFYTGTTLESFWTATDFDKVVLTWLRTSGFKYSSTTRLKLPGEDEADWEELFGMPHMFTSTWAHYPPDKTLASSVAGLFRLF